MVTAAGYLAESSGTDNNSGTDNTDTPSGLPIFDVAANALTDDSGAAIAAGLYAFDDQNGTVTAVTGNATDGFTASGSPITLGAGQETAVGTITGGQAAGYLAESSGTDNNSGTDNTDTPSGLPIFDVAANALTDDSGTAIAAGLYAFDDQNGTVTAVTGNATDGFTASGSPITLGAGQETAVGTITGGHGSWVSC